MQVTRNDFSILIGANWTYKCGHFWTLCFKKDVDKMGKVQCVAIKMIRWHMI